MDVSRPSVLHNCMCLSLKFLAVLLHAVQTHCIKLTFHSRFFLAYTVWPLSKTLVVLIRFDHQHIKGIVKSVGKFAAAHAFPNEQLCYWELADIQVETDIFAYR